MLLSFPCWQIDCRLPGQASPRAYLPEPRSWDWCNRWLKPQQCLLFVTSACFRPCMLQGIILLHLLSREKERGFTGRSIAWISMQAAQFTCLTLNPWHLRYFITGRWDLRLNLLPSSLVSLVAPPIFNISLMLLCRRRTGISTLKAYKNLQKERKLWDGSLSLIKVR